MARRGVVGPAVPPRPGALVSTYLSYPIVAPLPGVMLLLFLRERKARRG